MPYLHKLSDLNFQLENINRTDFTKKRMPSSGNAYDFLSGCVVSEMGCLRCNCSFKAGASYSVKCPYCGRKDQLRIQKGSLL